jgi:hypothetical protein
MFSMASFWDDATTESAHSLAACVAVASSEAGSFDDSLELAFDEDDDAVTAVPT